MVEDPPPSSRSWLAERVGLFTESAIREMTRLSEEHRAVNLAQGYPDFSPVDHLKETAVEAIRGDLNQYSVPSGSPKLRAVIAEKARQFNKIEADVDSEVTVTCGATEGVMATLLAVASQGDEVVLIEPFCENYVPGTVIVGARPRFARLDEPDYELNQEELKKAFGKKTKAILVNTPHNPTGRVFTADELKLIGDLCVDYNAIAITDEVYEHITYGANTHISLASLGNMRDRTVTVSSVSKSFAATGWRVGYVIAEKKLTEGIRRMHDFLTVCAPSPMQEAAAAAFRLPKEYYVALRDLYDRKRRLMVSTLRENGFQPNDPQGAYYILASFHDFGFKDDVVFSRTMVENARVAVVPASSFYSNQKLGKAKVRFAFCKRDRTLRDAINRIKRFRKARRQL